ncbi:pyrin domain-containing protein 1 [Rhynchonycteris naso]
MGKKRDAILDALENLNPGELKKFKMKLGTTSLREGFRNIPRGALGELDAVDLTDKLVTFYREDYAAQLTADILSEVGMQDEAERLREVQ